jgi:predicted ATPase
MSFLHGVSARSLRHLDRLEIDLRPAEGQLRQHLVLIGPNGSGKSILLEAMAEELDAVVDGRAHPAAALGPPSGDPERDDRERRFAHLGRPVRLRWACSDREVREAFAGGRLILAYLPDPRETTIAPATHPTPTDTDPRRPRDRVRARLVQRLLNRKTEEVFARDSGDAVRARVHEAWFLRVQAALRRLLHQPHLSLVHDRDGFHLDLPDGRRMHFDELSHGHASAVGIWAEIMMRVEAARLRNDDPTLEPAGVVLVDAAETDLDVRLQRELLPGLAELYPRVQLVVATHSPLVAMSLDDAWVFDLVRRRARSSDEIRRRGLESLLIAMIASERSAAEAPSSVPPSAPPSPVSSMPPPRAAPPAPRSVPSPVPSRAVGDPGSLRPPPLPARLGRSIPPASALPSPPPTRSAPGTVPAPPGKLPPKPSPRSRRGTQEGAGPWGPDDQG